MTRKDKKMMEYQRALVEQHFREVENMYRKMLLDFAASKVIE